jgi:hypothetical protein
MRAVAACPWAVIKGINEAPTHGHVNNRKNMEHDALLRAFDAALIA